MVKRILIAAGGTGGHLYPAQALAEQLTQQSPGCQLTFVAGGLKSNPYFDREKFSYQEISCSPLMSKNPLKVLKGLKNLWRGTCESIRMQKTFKPDVVVGFGSFYAVPVLLAAKWLKVPLILHEANSIPGKANKWMAPLADVVALNFSSASRFFNQKTVEVGMPLRDGYTFGKVDKKVAASYYGLSNEQKTLLVFGGSQGATAINRSMEECIEILKKLELQVIHLTGSSQDAERLASLYASNRIVSTVKPFEEKMAMAWSAADVFIGRSGASTLAESIEFEVPGILIPYPFATDRHQGKNAEYLVGTVGSGELLLQEGLNSTSLANSLTHFFREDKINKFKTALKRHKELLSQKTLCQLVLELAMKSREIK